MLKDAQQYKGSTIDYAEMLAGKSANVLKKGVGALNKTYRAGDNLFKLMAWENETPWRTSHDPLPLPDMHSIEVLPPRPIPPNPDSSSNIVQQDKHGPVHILVSNTLPFA